MSPILTYILYVLNTIFGFLRELATVFSCIWYLFFSIFRPSYHSRTVRSSCSGPRWQSGCRFQAVTEETCFWSRRSSGLWLCRERSWPPCTSFSLSTGRSSSAGRRSGRGTASRLRLPKPGYCKERRSAGGLRWSSPFYVTAVENNLMSIHAEFIKLLMQMFCTHCFTRCKI